MFINLRFFIVLAEVAQNDKSDLCNLQVFGIIIQFFTLMNFDQFHN